MKVIQVIPTLQMGGAETMCEALSIELQKCGVDVKVISLYNYPTPITERLIKSGVQIIFLDKKPGMDISVITKLRHIFEIEKPDAIHSHLNAQKYVMIAAKHSNVSARVHTVHSVADKELSKIDKILAKRFYKKHHVIPVALSDAIRNTIIKVYGLPVESIPVVFNGINLSRCIKKQDYALSDIITILHIGRFSQEKNHKGLIDSFKVFHSKKPNSVLKLIGAGPLFEDIKKYASDNGLDGAISFMGIQTNVYPYINESDIFVLPSIYEGIPMTLIEAMGTAIPIVATNVGGIPNMLSNDESALLTAVNSSEIADALIKLADNIALREKLGCGAYSRSSEFSSEKMARKYIEIYQSKKI